MLSKTRSYILILIGALVLGGLVLTSLYSYLLFHTLAEMFSIVVAGAIFMLVWNARRWLDNTYLLFVGVAYLFVGGLDMVHTLAYSGMGVFRGYETNLPTQLWIGARYMESISLLIASFFLGRQLKLRFVVGVYLVATSLILMSIFYWNVFPTCFVEGVGLTPFKKISEYVICVMFAVTFVTLLRKRDQFDPTVLRLLLAAIAFTILSELSFTMYVHAYGLFNLIGHLLKIVSFYLIYKAIIETGLTQPLAVLFKNLKESEGALLKVHDKLEQRVRERTASLSKVVAELKKEVAERKKIEETLRAKEYSLAEAQRIAHLGNWDWDIVTNELGWSDEVYRIFGLTPQEFGATYEAFLASVHPGDRDAAKKAMDESLADPHKPYNIEHRVVRPDGSERIVHERGEVTFDETGKAVRMVGTVHDITELKKAEVEAFHARRELLRIERVSRMGELTASLAHELNQPLTAILSNASAALRFLESDRLDPGELREILQDIVNDDKRAGNIIRSLRSMLKEEERERETISINDMLRDMLSLFHSEAIIRGIEVEMDLADPSPLVHVDKVQIQQVIINLTMNAAEAMTHHESEHRKIILKTRATDHSAVQVTVRDFGPGITRDTMDHVFDPFFTTKRSGLGMGLSVSRSIIEAHGGRMWVENNPDMGVTFYFEIPVLTTGDQ